MANRRALAIMSGLMGGAERASQNIMNITMAAEKLKREKKIQDLDYKLKEAQIENTGIEQLKTKQEYETKAKKFAGFLGQMEQYKNQQGGYAIPEGINVDWGGEKVSQGTQAVYDPATGQTVYTVPKGARPQPKDSAGNLNFMDDEAPAGQAQALPEGISEEDIAHTMKLHNLTRDEVLKRIQK